MLKQLPDGLNEPFSDHFIKIKKILHKNYSTKEDSALLSFDFWVPIITVIRSYKHDPL